MPRRNKAKAIKLVLDLQNATHLCVLLKKKDSESSTPSTFWKVNMRDVEAQDKAGSDPKKYLGQIQSSKASTWC